MSKVLVSQKRLVSVQKSAQRLAKGIATLYDQQQPGRSSLTPMQEAMLDSTLRYLDIKNEYKLGDSLRLAFKIELDVVKYHAHRT